VQSEGENIDEVSIAVFSGYEENRMKKMGSCLNSELPKRI